MFKFDCGREGRGEGEGGAGAVEGGERVGGEFWA